MKIIKKTLGFTLVETMVTVTILTIAAVGFTSLLITVQYTAEDNLYESTALTVALGTLEQMKNSATRNLENSQDITSFDLVIDDNDVTTPLVLDQVNILNVPVVTNAQVDKELPVSLIPRITTVNNGFMLEVQYAYDHPQSGREKTMVVRCMRSNAPTY